MLFMPRVLAHSKHICELLARGHAFSGEAWIAVGVGWCKQGMRSLAHTCLGLLCALVRHTSILCRPGRWACARRRPPTATARSRTCAPATRARPRLTPAPRCAWTRCSSRPGSAARPRGARSGGRWRPSPTWRRRCGALSACPILPYAYACLCMAAVASLEEGRSAQLERGSLVVLPVSFPAGQREWPARVGSRYRAPSWHA